MILRLKLWAIAIGTFCVAIATAYLRGHQNAVENQHENEVNEYVETRKRVDKAPSFTERDASLDWLRNRNQ